MISVVIPALNEGKTIRKVIQAARRSNFVSEIIVVDDQSADNTVNEAKKENVKIITSTELGKGRSMQEGMMMAINEIIVFLDADIPNYTHDIVDKLAAPLIKGEADFVKSYFERQAGRVTEILVKPLLEFFFPHLLQFKQPLSGMIAGKKSFFEKVEFENDYGVDIGLLIDMDIAHARICEVCIGQIDNDMQPLQALGKMARQVANAIFKRVKNLGFIKHHHEPAQSKRVQQELDKVRTMAQAKPEKLVVFDMDNTLLRGSFIHTAAEKFGFKAQLQAIIQSEDNSYTKTKRIAHLLEGRAFYELIQVVESIPVIGDAVHVIKELKLRGYLCGIISDSYHCITNHIKNMIGLDFSLANELRFKKSIVTGEVNIPHQLSRQPHSMCEHDYCKLNMLLYVLSNFGINIKNAIAVGDGLNDVCLLKCSGKGIALNSDCVQVKEAAAYVLNDESLAPLLGIIE
ncbi:MAG: HAD-IB family phosphatase [Bacteroidetes bacterium]|nr:HAD-IB family phosphatase [Bacteroidota bacterium]MBS1973769.1 HAD-IB family phosphatase [Bacteroidota bacterium]